MHKTAKFLLTLYVFVFLCDNMYKYAICVKIRTAESFNRNKKTIQRFNDSTTKVASKREQ